MTRLKIWARDLALGVRLAFRGARMRTALTAIGIGLSVGVLLFAAALPNAIHAHDERAEHRSIFGVVNLDEASKPVPPGASTAVVAAVTSIWRGDRVSGVLIQADGEAPPRPPGVDRVPAPGEIVVSPELARMLEQPGTELLHERLGGRVIGTIADAGLTGPAERFYYSGSTQLAKHVGEASQPGSLMRIAQFGTTDPAIPLDPFMRLLVLIGSIVLLFPIAILVSTASRFGSARRDRRLAALRLLGTTRRGTARIAAGESLAAGVVGVVLGVVLLVAARAIVEGIEAFGFSLFAADVQPDPLLSAAIIAAVLGVTIASTLLSMRRVSVEPLSVVRRGRGAKRRVWWRPLPTLAGFAVLAPLIGQSAYELGNAQNQVAVGALLVLVGIVALLPWLVDASVRRLRGWSVASQLAIRNLQTEAAVAARIVSGIAVAVAGAIALQMLLTVADGDLRETEQLGVQVSDATAGAYIQGSADDLRRLRTTIARTPGVVRVNVTTRQELRGHGHADGMLPMLIVGDCASLRELAAISRCDDAAGTVVRAVEPRALATAGIQLPRNAGGEMTVIPKAGERVKAHAWWAKEWAKFTLPNDVPTVDGRADPNGSLSLGILATPNAVPPPTGGTTDIQASVWLDPTDPLALERLRTTVATLGPLGNVYEATETSDADAIATARRLLMAGATLLLILIGASLVVTTFEQLGERRRSLATLAAFGTPRAVLRRALWWQTAIPVTIGLVLAVGIGSGLGALLLALQSEPITLDVPGTVGLLAISVGLVVVVTAAALPLLRSVASAQAMRTE